MLEAWTGSFPRTQGSCYDKSPLGSNTSSFPAFGQKVTFCWGGKTGSFSSSAHPCWDCQHFAFSFPPFSFQLPFWIRFTSHFHVFSAIFYCLCLLGLLFLQDHKNFTRHHKSLQDPLKDVLKALWWSISLRLPSALPDKPFWLPPKVKTHLGLSPN